MTRIFRMTALVALLAAVPVSAQQSGSSFHDLLQAIRLPTVTREARILGVPERDLQAIFASAREKRLPAGSLAELFSEENDAIRKHGPIDNFGAFVQEQLSSGLRGRELAAAIRAEHVARGIGKGRSLPAGREGANIPTTRPGGNSGNEGARGGKPDNPGKSEESGKKGGT